jgi:hypothetical protein
MSSKSLRLTADDEAVLARIRRRTGLTTSDALKRGLRALEKEIESKPQKTAWEIYQSLDLGEGGYAAGPATETRKTVRQILERKRAKWSSKRT